MMAAAWCVAGLGLIAVGLFLLDPRLAALLVGAFCVWVGLRLRATEAKQGTRPGDRKDEDHG